MNSTIYEEQVQRMADDHFLKISLKKLYEWLVEFDKYVEEFEDILNNNNYNFKFEAISVLNKLMEEPIA